MVSLNTPGCNTVIPARGPAVHWLAPEIVFIGLARPKITSPHALPADRILQRA
jgi:hypothetical protein